MNEMLYLADKLKELKDKKQNLEAKTKEINQKIEEVNKKLLDIMEEREIDNFTKDGTMFCITQKIRSYCKPDRKLELYKTLKEKGYGSLIYETVNANSLSSFVKEQIEENDDKLPSWLEELVNVYEQPRVNVRNNKIQ